MTLKGTLPEPYLTRGRIPRRLWKSVASCAIDSKLEFEVLSDLTALDWPKEEKFRSSIISFLTRINHRSCSKWICRETTLKFQPSKGYGRWPIGSSAKFSTLFGVIFEGHSDLRRIMLPGRLGRISAA